MEKVDFTSDNFVFMAKPDQYYIEGHPVKCDGDYTGWKPNKIIESGWGFFCGLTMVPYKGYTGELPRVDGDTASFGEFDIYYKGTLVNKMTYEGLYNMITRDSQLDKIL